MGGSVNSRTILTEHRTLASFVRVGILDVRIVLVLSVDRDCVSSANVVTCQTMAVRHVIK
jgi:hypothetical protein